MLMPPASVWHSHLNAPPPPPCRTPNSWPLWTPHPAPSWSLWTLNPAPPPPLPLQDPKLLAALDPKPCPAPPPPPVPLQDPKLLAALDSMDAAWDVAHGTGQDAMLQHAMSTSRRSAAKGQGGGSQGGRSRGTSRGGGDRDKSSVDGQAGCACAVS